MGFFRLRYSAVLTGADQRLVREEFDPPPNHGADPTEKLEKQSEFFWGDHEAAWLMNPEIPMIVFSHSGIDYILTTIYFLALRTSDANWAIAPVGGKIFECESLWKCTRCTERDILSPSSGCLSELGHCGYCQVCLFVVVECKGGFRVHVHSMATERQLIRTHIIVRLMS